jgi:hypothetical protein
MIMTIRSSATTTARSCRFIQRNAGKSPPQPERTFADFNGALSFAKNDETK